MLHNHLPKLSYCFHIISSLKAIICPHMYNVCWIALFWKSNWCCIYILLLTGPPRHSGPKLMLGGSVERHSLNLEVTDQAASFNLSNNLVYIHKSLSFFTLYNCTATLTWFIPFWIKTPIPQNAVMIQDVEHCHSSSERCARYCQTLDMLLKETEVTGMSCVSSIWAEIKPDCEGRCQLHCWCAVHIRSHICI